MSKTVWLNELNQEGEEWHKFRKAGLGSSEVSLLMNPKPQYDRTVYSLWKNKVGYEDYTVGMNEHILRGKTLEPFIRDEVNKILGTNYAPVCAYLEGSPYLRASMDGYDKETDSILEIKSPSDKIFMDYLDDWTVPEPYMNQIQYQLLVTGAKYAWYGFYNKLSKNPYLMLVEPNQYIMADIEKRAGIFWRGVQEKIPVGFNDKGEIKLFEAKPTCFVIMCDKKLEEILYSLSKTSYIIPITIEPNVAAGTKSFIYLCSNASYLPTLKLVNPNHEFKFISTTASSFNSVAEKYESLDELILKAL